MLSANAWTVMAGMTLLWKPSCAQSNTSTSTTISSVFAVPVLVQHGGCANDSMFTLDYITGKEECTAAGANFAEGVDPFVVFVYTQVMLW
jgi:hypothetical protein